MSKNVNIMVVKKDELSGLEEIQGVVPFSGREQLLNDIFAKAQYQFRPDMEVNEDYFQIIPYCVFFSVRQGELCVLAYDRLPGGGEAALAAFTSIGVGGHVDEEKDLQIDGDDEKLKNILLVTRSMARELLEETNISDETLESDPLFVFRQTLRNILSAHPSLMLPNALLVDTANEVGRKHVGLVYFLSIDDAGSESLKVAEEGLHNHGFLSLEELKEKNLEPWSRIAFDFIDEHKDSFVAEHHAAMQYEDSVRSEVSEEALSRSE